MSSRPDCICRIAYPNASVEDVHPVVTTWLGPRNPNRTLSSLESVPITPVGTQNKLMLLYCRWKKSRYCSSVNSCDPPPDPMITPKRRFWARGREAASMPATPNASVAAAIASGSTRETCLRSRRSTHASSSKSATTPAICTEISDASNREMRRTPLRPSSTACEKDELPTPLGLTAPMPVITTRRCNAHLNQSGIYQHSQTSTLQLSAKCNFAKSTAVLNR